MTDVEAKTNNKRKGLTGNAPANKKAKFGKNADGPKQKFGKNTKGNQGAVQNGAKAQQKQGPKQKQNNPNIPAKKDKKNSISEDSPAKKMKPFAGTGDVQNKKQKQVQKKEGVQSGGDSEKKKRRNQFSTLKAKLQSGDASAIQSIDEKIKAIQSRGDLTKTANRKLKMLQRMRRSITGEKPTAPPAQKQNKTAKKAAQQQGKPNAKAKAVKAKAKPAKVVAQDEESDEDDEDDEFVEGATAEADSDDEGDSGEEVEGESDEDDEEEEEDDDDEEDEDDSDDEEEAPKIVKKEKPHVSKDQSKNSGKVKTEDLLKNNLISKNQKRYVVFVGNIPYDVKNPDLKQHFEKCGTIKHIRIPTEKGSNKPRGFAYVEVEDEDTYQKCLSMHHSFINGRRINVLYTQGGKKKGEEQKNKIKAKNFKLNAMRRQGQLKGSKKESQKRSFRRNKQKQAVKPDNAE